MRVRSPGVCLSLSDGTATTLHYAHEFVIYTATVRHVPAKPMHPTTFVTDLLFFSLSLSLPGTEHFVLSRTGPFSALLECPFVHLETLVAGPYNRDNNSPNSRKKRLRRLCHSNNTRRPFFIPGDSVEWRDRAGRQPERLK